MRTKFPVFVALFLGACTTQSFAQPAFDSSGDGKLNGTYYFRQVLYVPVEVGYDYISIMGNISFDGNGNYTLSNATILDASTGSSTPQSLSATGTYSISASGEGLIQAVDVNDFPNDLILGLVSTNGVFIGSSTENTTGYNDLFIAAPVGSSPATNATLSGSYRMAYFDPTIPVDAILSFNANGSGNIGNVTTTQYAVDVISEVTATAGTLNPTLSGVTYAFSNGAAQLSFGGSLSSSNLIAGTEILYTSPDGNFVFGGNFNGFDMFVGVKNASSTPSNYQALYYQAGADNDFTDYPDNNGLDSYFGAANILSDNTIIAHQRVSSLAIPGSEDYVYSDLYAQTGDGSASDSFYDYWSSADGSVRIGYGTGTFLGINVAFQAPSLTPSGSVYLSPVGVVNAASNAPFTAFVSPGEFLTLFGTGLASKTDSAGVPLPASLDGVSVTINGVAAPVYFVSSNQVSVIVPYITTPGSVAQIQLTNSQGSSNTVTAFTGQTSVGVFTNTPEGGDGIAASELQDNSIVSEDNPAQEGLPVSLYVSGMGAVSPAVSDGAAAPGNPLSNTELTPAVAILDSNGNEAEAAESFSGLAPGFAGLYQVNVTVPSGLAPGDAAVDIYSGSDSENFESILPIGSAGSARPAARIARHARLRAHRRPARQLFTRRSH